MGRIRTISVFALLLAAAVLAMVGTASATPLDYTFNGNNQGWQVTQDQAAGPQGPATFKASGGNPGGRLTATDSGPEAGCATSSDPCQLVTFYSPFVVPLATNYGGMASFDLRSSVNPAFAAEFLLLAAGSEYLDGLIPETTGTDYHHLSIKLDESARQLDGSPAWAVCPYAGGKCSAPSQAEFISLIAATDVVAVIADVGELNPDGTGETYDLDNVSLTDGTGLPTPPLPPAGGPPPTQKHKKCKKKRHKDKAAATRTAAATAAAKKCKKKRRSASSLRG